METNEQNNFCSKTTCKKRKPWEDKIYSMMESLNDLTMDDIQYLMKIMKNQISFDSPNVRKKHVLEDISNFRPVSDIAAKAT